MPRSTGWPCRTTAQPTSMGRTSTGGTSTGTGWVAPSGHIVSGQLSNHQADPRGADSSKSGAHRIGRPQYWVSILHQSCMLSAGIRALRVAAQVNASASV